MALEIESNCGCLLSSQDCTCLALLRGGCLALGHTLARTEPVGDPVGCLEIYLESTCTSLGFSYTSLSSTDCLFAGGGALAHEEE